MMRSAISPLIKKELRQNALIYLSPLPFLLGLLYLRWQGVLQNPPDWFDPVFIYAMPLTLAVAFGLQAFDVEVDRQTRDFLLVKPLSARRIVAEKLILGLLMLFGWTVLFMLAADAKLLQWPRPLPVSTWSCALAFLWAGLAYTGSYFVGLCVPGAKKLLAAAAIGAAAIAWSFFTWSSWNSFVLQNAFLGGLPWLSGLLFYLGLLAVIVIGMGLLLQLTLRYLYGKPRLATRRALRLLLGLAVLAPALSLGLNFLCRPTLRAANFLGLELFGYDRAFWAIKGAWRPGTDEIAVAGAGNTLGIARPGEKPRLIFQGKPEPGKNLEDLAWSPDGKYLVFREGGQLYLMPAGKAPIAYRAGTAPCWARTSDMFLYNAGGKALTAGGGSGPGPVYYRLNLNRIKPNLADPYQYYYKPYMSLDTTTNLWYWESEGDWIMLVDPSGFLHLLHGGKDEVRPLSGAAGLRAVTVWSQILPLPGGKDQYLVAVMSARSAQTDRFDLAFYRLALAGQAPQLLASYPQQRLTNLILLPASGACLLGNSGVYRRVGLNLAGGVR